MIDQEELTFYAPDWANRIVTLWSGINEALNLLKPAVNINHQIFANLLGENSKYDIYFDVKNDGLFSIKVIDNMLMSE